MLLASVLLQIGPTPSAHARYVASSAITSDRISLCRYVAYPRYREGSLNVVRDHLRN
jgi:hypothetical protein